MDIRLSGRLFLDAGFFMNNPEEVHSGTHLPEIRLGGKIKIGSHWCSKIDIGFSNGKVSLKDAYLEYGKNENYFRAGYMLGFYSIDQSTSTNDLVFNTPANVAETFYPGRHTGISFTRSVMNYYLSFGVFPGDKLNYAETTKPGYNLSGRGVWRPVNDGYDLVHIGTGMTFRKADLDKETGKRSLRLKSKGVTELTVPAFLEIEFEDSRYQTQNNIEYLQYRGKWMVQSELMSTYIRMESAQDNFTGYGGYLQGGFLLKGNRYGYDETDALPVMPVEKGSLLLLARVNYTHLNNKRNHWYGGTQKDLSAGLNYYFNQYISTRLNYNLILTDRHAALGKQSIHIVQARIQIRF